MQYRPTAAELLEAIGDLLGTEVLDAVPDSLRHRVRVAHNLSQILRRECELGEQLAERETAVLRALVERAGGDAPGELDDLRAQLSAMLRASDDPGFDRTAWEALVAIARDDLAIAKPGHDRWEGT